MIRFRRVETNNEYFSVDNLREVSSWSIDLPSKANFSLPLNVDVLVALSYEILFCSRFDNLKFDKFSPLL